MKKIFFSLVALAALAACSKSNIEYADNQMEISFAPVSKVNTKAAITSTDYPDALDMYVFAEAGEPNVEVTGDNYDPYFKNALFQHGSNADNVFSGATPYYWPNVKKLIFSGLSASGNVNAEDDPATTNVVEGAIPTYEYNTTAAEWQITLEGYTPTAGTATLGNNDLMWFSTVGPFAKPATQRDWTVDAIMKHACAWVTINIKGDDVTGATGSSWQIDDLKFAKLSQSGDVVLGSAAQWTPAEAKEFDAYTKASSTTLTSGYVDYTQLTYKDLVVIPQSAKTLTVTYTFESDPVNDITTTEVKEIPLTFDGGENWEAGKHYIYNITIGTQEILIHPKAQDWTVVTAPDIVL